MEKKNFYAATVDDYQYSEVTTKRYKNFVDFMISQWEEDLESELKKYLEPAENNVDWQEFFEDYYGYSVYYFALDEDGNELEDLEDKNTTLNNYCKEHNLI